MRFLIKNLNSNAMIFKKKALKHYAGIDCSGVNHVLPPSFEGLSSLMEKVHNSLFAASQAFPDQQPEDLPGDEVLDFVEELSSCDKIDKISLINDFQEYIQDLQIQAAKKAQLSDPVSVSTGTPAGDPEPSKN